MSEIVYNIDARAMPSDLVRRLEKSVARYPSEKVTSFLNNEGKLMNKPEITLKISGNGKFNIFVDGKPLPSRDIKINQEFRGVTTVNVQLVLFDGVKLEGSD